MKNNLTKVIGVPLALSSAVFMKGCASYQLESNYQANLASQAGQEEQQVAFRVQDSGLFSRINRTMQEDFVDTEFLGIRFQMNGYQALGNVAGAALIYSTTTGGSSGGSSSDSGSGSGSGSGGGSIGGGN